MVVFTKIKKGAWDNLTGFVKEEPKTIYEELRLSKDGAVLIFYSSGKLMLQGKKDAVKKISDELISKGIGTRESSSKFRKEEGIIIGSDESLKGDTFGGIVVAAVKADEKLRKELTELGVADSKNLSDNEVLFLAEKIKKIAECEIRSILPKEYNHFIEHHKVTELLNKLHKECGNFLMPGIHVVDKYPGCNVGKVREEKAESKYVEVAAASILARAAALQQLDFLSVGAGFTVPKGSTHVLFALRKLQEKGMHLKDFVKIDFKNVKEFLEKEFRTS